ncbi:TonB-dependent receptor domain-containing protein [Spirosoma gilvum]
MNLFYSLSCFLIGVCTPAWTQTRLTGAIWDDSGKPLPFASIALLRSPDSSLVKGTISQESGSYALDNIRPGQYRLVASAVGYAPGRSELVLVGTTPIQLPVLTLQAATKSLREVAVAARKPLFEQQIDRLVINVQSSITAAGGSALDILERSPGITVNRQNNSLTLSGKGGVMVMLNAKLTRLPIATVMEMLAGMPASDIEKIELITSPPARYDAEGDAGLINIVTKKNSAYGTNGSLSATVGYGWYERPSATLNLNHRQQKLNLYGSYSFVRNRSWEEYALNRVVSQTDVPLMTDIVSNRFTLRTIHTARLGFDYTLNPHTTLSGLISGFSNKWSADMPTRSSIWKNGELISQNTIQSDRTNQWKHGLINLTLRHVFTNKQEWSLDIDRLYYYNQNPAYYANTIQYLQAATQDKQQFRTLKETPVRMWVLKTDFTKPLGTKGRLETGLKTSIASLNNSVTLDRQTGDRWQADTLFTNQYSLTETILAGYVSLNQPLDAKTTLQAGVRYEYTQTDIDTPEGNSLVHRRYGNFFPTIFLSRKLNRQHTVNLTYTRRITRPSYDALAPFFVFYDPNTFLSGNPALFPAISDAIQGSYIFKDIYAFSIKYTQSRNVIAPLQPHLNPATNQLYYYPENMARQNTLSLTTSLPIKITSWWQSQNNLTGLYQNLTTTYQNQPINQALYTLQLTSSHTIKLPRRFTAEVTGMYQGPFVSGLYRTLASGQVTVGVQKLLPADKGTLRLAVSDLFWTNVYRTQSNLPTLNLNDRGTYHFEPRVVQFTYMRNFGSQTVKAANRRVTGSEEERGRLSQ